MADNFVDRLLVLVTVTGGVLRRLVVSPWYVHIYAPLVAGQVLGTLVAMFGIFLWRRDRRRIEGSVEEACMHALACVSETWSGGGRRPVALASSLLGDAALRTQRRLTEGDGSERPLAVATLPLVASIAALLQVATRAVPLEPTQRKAAEEAHRLVVESMACVAVVGRGVVDLDAARVREIELNGKEAVARAALAACAGAPAGALWLSELIDAYEAVGNRLWRYLNAANDQPGIPGR